MAFEQNQQDQFNMNNGIDQLKQFKTELDKATASIGAAELDAEEELLGIRLKNLSKAQQTKLTQLGQMLELEEKGIQELAKLKLTLSNRQFAVRKKEIQKEFQEYKAAADEFFKTESKRKATQAPSGSKKQTDDLKIYSKSADAAIQKANKKVQSAIYGVDKVYQNVSEAIASLQDVASHTQNLQKETKKVSANTAKAVTSQVSAANTTEETGAKAEIHAQEERQLPNGGMDARDKVGLSDNTPESIREGFEGIREYLNKTSRSTKKRQKDSGLAEETRVNKTVKKDLNTLTGQGSKASQTSLDLAGNLISSINAANEAEAKLKEFTANQDLNTRLIFARKEHELRKALFEKEEQQITNRANLEADIAATRANRDKLIAQEEEKTRQTYLAEYNELQLDSWNHLTENMTAAEFEKLRFETAKIEEAIAARSKASEASEKALATLRGKGTLAEKKQLLEAQVKERAAEKDWSGTKYEITDDMSDE